MGVRELCGDVETKRWTVFHLVITKLQMQPAIWRKSAHTFNLVYFSEKEWVVLCTGVSLTNLCHELVKNWVERRLQLLLDILQQNRIPKLDGILQHPQVVWHLKVYYFQTLHMWTHINGIFYKAKYWKAIFLSQSWNLIWWSVLWYFRRGSFMRRHL